MNRPPVASMYDALSLVAGISTATATRSGSDSGATEQEVHALAYLACQLGKWTDADLDWGYAFFTTDHSEPFAAELSSSISDMLHTGALQRSAGLIQVTPRGQSLLELLSKYHLVAERLPYLDAAIHSISLLSAPLVLRGILRDPTLAPSHPARALLDEVAMNVLSEYREALVHTIGEAGGPLALCELWIRYLLAAHDSEVA